MACGCAADGGEPRNTVGAAPSEAAATCSGESVDPRNTSVEETRSGGGECEGDASATVKSARAETAAAVNSTAWANRLALRIAGLLSLSLRASFILSSPLEKRGEVPRLRLKRGIAI